MERSAVNSDKSSKADSSKESASRIRPVGENERRWSLIPFEVWCRGRSAEVAAPRWNRWPMRMASMPVAQRREAALSLQRTRGNRFVQRMAVAAQVPVQAKREPNRTGMPDGLKAGIESLSGIDMSDVRVHANSDKPAQLNALAYTQGNEIYLEAGEERNLPHEAWHAVQQKQGRVRATMQMREFGINDDLPLEQEADMMGAKAAQFVPKPEKEPVQENFGEGLAEKAPNNTGQTDRDCTEYSADTSKIHRLLAGTTNGVVQKRDANLSALSYSKNNGERLRTVRYGERGEVSEQDKPYTGLPLVRKNLIDGIAGVI